MCEFKQAKNSDGRRPPNPIKLRPPVNSSFITDHVRCPKGHVTHAFLACDVQADCFSSRDWSYMSPKESWDVPSNSTCSGSQLTSLPPSFLCGSVVQRVPYSMVCDHRQDCQDNSDEDFCQFLPCPLNTMTCGNSKQCFTTEEECNGLYNCLNGADEMQCVDSQLDPLLEHALPVIQLPPPAIVTLDGKGKYEIEPLNTESCPESHFQCSNNGYCLPVYVRCNAVFDCPGREDEDGCGGNSECPGFYKCRSSSICLHHSHMCDGVTQCPQFEDEMWCNMTCPLHCRCWGLAYICRRKFPAQSTTYLRYIDARNSGMRVQDFARHVLLIHLGLAQCDLSGLGGNVTFGNLHSLDLSYNLLHVFSIKEFTHLPRLRVLLLSGNPLNLIFEDLSETKSSIPLYHLDMSYIKIHYLNFNVLAMFTQLQFFNLSGCDINRMSTTEGNLLKQLRVLDTRGCPLNHFPKNIFKDLMNLQTMYADNFKVCCKAALPVGFNPKECHAPFDEISSCDALLRSDAYRVFLSASAGMALIGNLASFGFRLLREKKLRSGFHVFVSHLCVSDFLMGLYLSIIGVADRIYRGTYLWEDTKWRHSTTCKIAGLISLVSSEASVFIICLITIDRFLALRFPFSKLKFHYGAAQLASSIVWAISFVLAIIPLFPAVSFGDFYSHVGVCMPLPITRKEFDGDDYAFGITIVLNFVIFILIAIGQCLIYQTVHANALSVSDGGKLRTDTAIARRLITVAVTDFFCWFPIGLLGLLASQGVSVSGEVTVAMVIFALPVNSVINPFLYTFNMIMEQRRKAKEARVFKWLEKSQHS